MSPVSTALMAGLMSSSMRTNHCSFTMGSTVVPHRSWVPTLWVRSSMPTRRPMESSSFTMASLAAYRSMPWYLPPFPLIVASSFRMLMTGRLWRFPTSKSLGSWAGVIFTTPVPSSGSACSSATIGIFRSMMGSHAYFPIRSLYLLSSGFTARAVSPSMVSGRVVANSRNLVFEMLPSSSTSGYLMCQKWDFCSLYSTSASEMEVWHFGHQFTMRLPL